VSIATVAPALRHDFSAGALGHDAGEYQVNVNERTMLAGDVAYACVRIIADAVADARWGEWRGTEQLIPSRLVRRPMSTWTRRYWSWRVASTLALYNVCHLERIGEDSEGVPLSLVPLRPGQLRRDESGYVIDNARSVSDDAIVTIHRAAFPTLTEETASILRLAREQVAAQWAADAYRADFWENGGAPAVVITSDQELNDTQADGIRDRWTERRRSAPGAPAVLGKGARAEPFGADMDGEGAASAAERLGQSLARFFGVPAWLVNVASAAGSMTYSNTESAGLDLVRYTLRGYLGPIEDCLSDELPADYILGRRVALDVSHLTQGTILERAQAAAIATAGKPWMRPGEIRAEWHLPPDDELDAGVGAPAPAMESIA
jgi:HK97 family phage portal protein